VLLHLTRGRKSRLLDIRHSGFFLLRVSIPCLRLELPMKLDHTRVPPHDGFVGGRTRFGGCRSQGQGSVCCSLPSPTRRRNHVQPPIPTLTYPPQPPSFMGRDRSRSLSSDDRRRERRRDRSKDDSHRMRSRSRSKDRDRRDRDRDPDKESSKREHRSRSRDGGRSHKR
jgi:hypothetical protein